MMATPGTNSWLNTSLMSPAAAQQHTTHHHALYGSDVQQLQSASHVQRQQNVNLGPEASPPCGAFCQPDDCPLNLDFHQSTDSPQDFSKPAGESWSGGHTSGKGSGEYGGQVSARKIHKADREKLRRERLNEQFAELAGVLDPDRPKHDKATILGDSVQVVKELRSEVKRLRAEQNSLLDESRDLAQEKTELRDEKSTLKTETEHLQGQIQQRLRLMLPWMSMDQSTVMPQYGYPMPGSQPVSGPPATAELQQKPGLQHGPMPHPQPGSAAPPYMPLPLPNQGAFALHPALQAYTMYANRPGDGKNPYLPYPHYPSQVNSHPQVERPYPQYPSPMQPYLMHMQGHQGQSPMTTAPPVSSMYQSFVPGMPMMPPQTERNPPNTPGRLGARHLESAYGHHGPSVMQPYPEISNLSVQTTLQLQTPLKPQPQQPSKIAEREGSSKADTGGTPSLAPGTQREIQPAIQSTKTSGVVGPTDFAPLTRSPADLSRLGSCTTTHGRGETVGAQGGGGGTSVAPQQKDNVGSHDKMLRPAAA